MITLQYKRFAISNINAKILNYSFPQNLFGLFSQNSQKVAIFILEYCAMVLITYLSRKMRAFCLTTPLFLTILTLNLPKVNIVTYRITAIIGVIIGLYNMMNFFNPHTVWLGVVHVPLLTISLYSAILSYRVHPNS